MKARFSARLFRCCSACLLLAWQVQAKNLGTHGATFEIQEPDLLQVIEQKVSILQTSGRLDTLQKTWQSRAKTALEQPKPVSHIRHTTKPRTFYFDPSITVSEDLKDHQGMIFHKVGTRVNPLQTRPLTRVLLFLDGDDSAQLKWALAEAKQRQNKTILILVKGSPLKQMEQTKLRFYFDQGGQLVQKLGIQQVPARVVQVGLMLKIDEILP